MSLWWRRSMPLFRGGLHWPSAPRVPFSFHPDSWDMKPLVEYTVIYQHISPFPFSLHICVVLRIIYRARGSGSMIVPMAKQRSIHWCHVLYMIVISLRVDWSVRSHFLHCWYRCPHIYPYPRFFIIPFDKRWRRAPLSRIRWWIPPPRRFFRRSACWWSVLSSFQRKTRIARERTFCASFVKHAVRRSSNHSCCDCESECVCDGRGYK